MKSSVVASKTMCPTIRGTRGKAQEAITSKRSAWLLTTIEQLDAAGECLTGLAEFLSDAKPAEIRLLGKMLQEWANWTGSLRAGNFFAGVAQAVLDDTETQLRAWPTDRRKTAARTKQRERTIA